MPVVEALGRHLLHSFMGTQAMRTGIQSTVAAALLCAAMGASAQDSAKPAEQPPVFDKAYMADPANIEVGRQVWQQQCRHCHGASAYPGKAPKLVPGPMEPDFIYDRVAYGFRKMPAWKDVFTREQLMGVTAFIKSPDFSP